MTKSLSKQTKIMSNKKMKVSKEKIDKKKKKGYLKMNDFKWKKRLNKWIDIVVVIEDQEEAGRIQRRNHYR